MSAHHRAEDIDQVSLTDLLDADEHLPRTVLVELSFATSRGDRRITVRRLSDFEESPRPPPRTAPSTEHEVPLIRHMIRYGPEVGWNGYRVAQGKTMDDVRNVLDGNDRGSACERH